jgi:WD40 repeat protein
LLALKTNKNGTGQLVLAGSDTGDLVLWDVVSKRKVKQIACHKGAFVCLFVCRCAIFFSFGMFVGPIKSLCVSTDGHKVVTAGDDKSISYFEA